MHSPRKNNAKSKYIKSIPVPEGEVVYEAPEKIKDASNGSPNHNDHMLIVNVPEATETLTGTDTPRDEIDPQILYRAAEYPYNDMKNITEEDADSSTIFNAEFINIYEVISSLESQNTRLNPYKRN